MKIYEIITEKYVDYGPEEDKRARDEYAALKKINTRFADAFMNAYNEFGSVDAAYEKARADAVLAKQALDKQKVTRTASTLYSKDKAKIDQAIQSQTPKRSRGAQSGNQNARKFDKAPAPKRRGKYKPTSPDPYKKPSDLFTTTTPFSAGLELGDKIADPLFNRQSWNPDNISDDDVKKSFFKNLMKRSSSKNLEK